VRGVAYVCAAIIIAAIIIGVSYYYANAPSRTVTRTATVTAYRTVTTTVTVSAPARTVTKTATLTTTSTATVTSSVVSTTTVTASASAAKHAQSYVVVTDARGVKVRIPEPVKRVVTLYGLAPPFLYLLGVGDKYYGGWSWGGQFYQLIDPNFSKKCELGRMLNVEAIVKIHPQLVIASTWERVMREVKQLQSLGIPVVCIKIESVKDVCNTILMLGKIFQREAYAQKIVNYYENAVKYVESKVANVKVRPKVLVIYYSGRHHALRTFGGDMFQSRLIELAGGVSVSENITGKKSIDVEQVAKWNPDVIIIIQYGYPASKVKHMILTDPAWSKIKAVEEGNVYIVPNDGENWIDPCPKWVLGLFWLAKLLHPHLFAGLNITKIAASYYKEFFNLSISKVHIIGDLNAEIKG